MLGENMYRGVIAALAAAGLALPAMALPVNFSAPDIVRDGGAAGDDTNEKASGASDGTASLAVWQNLGAGNTWDVLYVRSTDSGASWGSPLNLSNQAIAPDADDVGPTPAAANGTFIVVWTNDGELFYSRSVNFASAANDAAVVWSAPASVNDDANDPKVGTDGAGNWLITWEGDDADSGNSSIFGVYSSDDGVSFGAPFQISNFAVDQTDDGDSEIAFGEGTWLVCFKSDGGSSPSTDDEDVYVSASANGTTFGTPILVHNWGTSDAAADDNPEIAFGNGRFVIVWQSDFDLNGESGGDDEIIVASTTPDNLNNWTISTANSATVDSGDDGDPSIATDTNGTFVCAWASDEDGDGDIYAAYSSSGVSWDSIGQVSGDNTTEEEEPNVNATAAGSFNVVYAGNDTLDIGVANGTVEVPEQTASITGSRVVEIGGTIRLNVGVPGLVGNVEYEWSRDGESLPDQTGATLVVTDVTLDDGGAYVATVTDESAKGVFASTAFVVSVVEQLPAAGGLGLAALAAGLALAGAALRRRK